VDLSTLTQLRIGDLTLSVQEAEETLRAIRAGDIDAVVVEGNAGHEVFTFRDPGQHYRLLVEAMNEGAALLSADGLIGYHNPRLAQMVEAPASLVGRSLADFVSGGDRPRLDAMLVKARSQSARDEFTFVGDEGLALPVQVSLSAAAIASVPVVCVVVTDLREHKAQEERYRAARLEVEARDRVFSMAGHELNGPLGALELQTFLLAEQLKRAAAGASIQPDKALNMADVLRRQTMRLSELIRKVLDLASIRAGKLLLSPEDVDLSDVVRAVVERTEGLVRQSGSTVTVELRAVRGHWDRIRLEQVVTNLLSNAAKYGLGKPIRVAVEKHGETARLVVEDQGSGIPPSEHQRLFQPYERMATSKATPGLGLGLYIASQIVEAHRGKIRIESEPGSGSRFIVELPLAAPQG
jgi:PAS domain S-box-containing protein